MYVRYYIHILNDNGNLKKIVYIIIKIYCKLTETKNKCINVLNIVISILKYPF